jgi:hypothetical protein
VLAGIVPISLKAGQQAAAGRALWSDSFEDSWPAKWHLHKRNWGLKNAQAIQEAGGSVSNFLRVVYPRGSASPTVTRATGAPVGGVQFYADLGLAPRDSLHLGYYVRFAPGFDFVRGGKLPGLFGGTVGSGGHIPDGTDGFSTRLMWRKGGDGEVYAYLPSSVQHGTSLGRGRWRFIPGRWYLVEQAVRLNTPGQANGRIELWIDERPVLSRTDLVFRTTPDLKIEGILFSTFFGGGDTSWATPRTTHADFGAFAVGDGYIGPKDRQTSH